MLYRFREALAAELGLGARNITRNRRYKTVCLSRVASQDHVPRSSSTAGLTDYEVRDLNDEINKLMRHWENQTIALGSVNYISHQLLFEL